MFPFIASDGERCLVLGRDFCKCVKYNCIYVIVYIAKIRDYEKLVSDYPNLTAVSAACEILRIHFSKSWFPLGSYKVRQKQKLFPEGFALDYFWPSPHNGPKQKRY